MKEYCTQNREDCSSCSISSYGKDCRNNPIRGGYREGSGRPSTGRSKKTYYVTADEDKLIREYISKLRDQS